MMFAGGRLLTPDEIEKINFGVQELFEKLEKEENPENEENLEFPVLFTDKNLIPSRRPYFNVIKMPQNRGLSFSLMWTGIGLILLGTFI